MTPAFLCVWHLLFLVDFVGDICIFRWLNPHHSIAYVMMVGLYFWIQNQGVDFFERGVNSPFRCFSKFGYPSLAFSSPFKNRIVHFGVPPFFFNHTYCIVNYIYILYIYPRISHYINYIHIFIYSIVSYIPESQNIHGINMSISGNNNMVPFPAGWLFLRLGRPGLRWGRTAMIRTWTRGSRESVKGLGDETAINNLLVLNAGNEGMIPVITSN